MAIQVERARGLEAAGILRSGPVHWNLSPPALCEVAIVRREGRLAADGPLVCLTGHHTGRSPNDKFFVREPSSEPHIHWGDINRSIDEAAFDALHRDMARHLQDKELYVLDAWAGADPAYRLPIRVVNEFAWHNLFARNMFIPEDDAGRRAAHAPEFTVIDAPSFRADPARHGSRSDCFIYVHLGKRLVLIGGTSYAGEIKKSIFTILNYTLPLGDDEHGWSDRGVFNFEGGCYAKVIKLSQEAEPLIYATTHRFGTILENVVMDPATRVLDLDDATLTENTRSSYPLSVIDNAITSGQAGHPQNIVMLTADAYGVLPPIARLTPDRAMYHFLSGYTARVAGTEKGVTEPKAVFSTCFGAPFLPLSPNVYARMLGEKIARHGAKVWLVNTGWTGGPYGVGSRMKIGYTRAMIAAALAGKLEHVPYQSHPIFNVDMPAECPGVPASVLDPRTTWADRQAYDAQASTLARMFAANFTQFETHVSEAVRAAGPKV